MKQVESGHPERIAFRATGVVFAVAFGLVFVLGGAAMMYFDVPVSDGPPWSLKAFGGGAVAFGLLCMSIRGGTMIDREKKIVSRWIGLLVPMYTRTRPFEARAVRLTREFSTHKGQRIYTYPISLSTPEGDLQLGAGCKVMPAWTAAQAIATFLQLDLVDESPTPVNTNLIPTVVRAIAARRG